MGRNTRKFQKACERCGTLFFVVPADIRCGRGKFCNRKCKDKWMSERSTDNNRIAERFWGKVDKTKTCWIWKGSKLRDDFPYGQIYINGKNQLAHRFAWEIENGSIPNGYEVLHSCDNPSCVRNDGKNSHLFLGTQMDNVVDMIVKGRGGHKRRVMPTGDKHWSRVYPERVASGEKNGSAKLTEQKVQEIRELINQGMSQRKIAERFHVSHATVGHISRGANWSNH